MWPKSCLMKLVKDVVVCLYVTNVNRGQLQRKRVDCCNSLNESIANMVRDID